MRDALPDDEGFDDRPIPVRVVEPREWPTPFDDLESPDARRQPVDDLARRLDGRHGIQLADADQCRAVDPAELADDIEPTHQVHAVPAELGIPHSAGELVGVRHARPEGGEHAVPFGVGDGLAAVVAPRQLGDLVAAEAPEPVDQSFQVEPSHRGLQDEPARVPRVPRAVEHGDEATHRVAEHDRPRDPERVAEGADVVGARLEGPFVDRRPRGTAVSTQVQVDDLGGPGQVREVGLEVGMVVGARPAVDEHDRRPLPHRGAVGHERGSVDVEPQPGPVDVDLHRRSPGSFGLCRPQRRADYASGASRNDSTAAASAGEVQML